MKIVMLLPLFGALPALAADPASCLQSAGPKQSATYVEQCRSVSPATHPPCNAANPCDLMIDEIRRGCTGIHQDLIDHPDWAKDLKEPDFCKSYRQ